MNWTVYSCWASGQVWGQLRATVGRRGLLWATAQLCITHVTCAFHFAIFCSFRRKIPNLFDSYAFPYLYFSPFPDYHVTSYFLVHCDVITFLKYDNGILYKWYPVKTEQSAVSRFKLLEFNSRMWLWAC